MQTILITGAAGRIGTRLRTLMKGAYPNLRWSDLCELDDRSPDETFVKANLADMAEVEKAVEGVDGIVHLGGFAVEGPWPTILNINLVGCYNLFEAARRAKVKRIVFASSNHAVGFYPRQRRITTEDPVRPDSLYGASKAYGEALGALYAFKHGLRVTCLRIGHVLDRPKDARDLAIWLAPEDLLQLIRIGLDHPDIRYEIFFGVSDNRRSFCDNGTAIRYGYAPQHRADDYADAALAATAKNPPGPVEAWYQGGEFCSSGFEDGIERSPT